MPQARMPAGPPAMPSTPMPSGPPAMWHSPPPPPRHAPPTVQSQPAGMSHGGRHAEHMEALNNVQDMLAVVSQRVQPMLTAAARHSETQVGNELKKIEAAFKLLREKAARVEASLAARSQSNQQLPKDSIAKMLIDLQLRWDQEIKAVKRELHQTILAHNHNADLMADHKIAIDKIIGEVAECDPPAHLESPELSEALTQLGGTLERNRAQDQDIDALLHRGELLMQRFGASMASRAMPAMGGAPMSAAHYAAGQAYHQGHYAHMAL